MALTKVQNGMIAIDAVTPTNLASSGIPTDQTILNGVFGWIYQDSYYFDLGTITLPVGNMVLLLLQVTPIDFNQPTLAWDGGSII